MGKSGDFIKVDTAYDLLKHYVTGSQNVSSSYWLKNFLDLEKKFKQAWQEAFKTAKNESTGLWYSTCIKRSSGAYIYPHDDWYRGVLFPEPTTSDRDYYREFLLSVAPNQKLREEWAIKYYRLEFGFNTPYTFYLAPANNQSNHPYR